MKLFVCVTAAVAAFSAFAGPLPAGTTRADGEAAAEFVPGQVIVRFRAAAGRSGGADALDALGASVRRELAVPRTILASLPDGWSVPEAVAALEAHPDVLYAEPNFVYRLARTPDDPFFPQLWALSQASDRDLDAPEAWDVTTGSGSVVVAVIDSGIAYDHPDLTANVWTNAADPPGGGDEDGNGKVDDTRGWDFVEADAVPLDPNGHGTHVAGTIGATGDNATGVVGVNWEVSLMALRAADRNGALSAARVADAVAYACSKGARVVNGSFGGPSQSGTIFTALGLPACANTLFIFAAGNGGQDGIGDNNDASPQFPCNYALPRILCVAASDRSDAKTRFSNFGASTVDLAAPGVEIASAWPGSHYIFAGGTSMATPHVSGVAALVLARFPALAAQEVQNRILNGVDAVPGLVGYVATGGRLNALGALNATASPFVSPPSPPPALPPPAPPPPAPPPTLPPPSAPATPRTTPPDTVAPNTRLARVPARATRAPRAVFTFSSTEPASRFECRLDRGRWTGCSSPRAYRALRPGAHTFRVRAIDAAGNVDATPATRTWRVR
jgi:serine protease